MIHPTPAVAAVLTIEVAPAVAIVFEPSDPYLIREIWWDGFGLGSEGKPADAPVGLPADQVAAFRAGYASGFDNYETELLSAAAEAQARPRQSRPQPFPVLAPGEEPDGRWFGEYFEGRHERFVVAAGEGTIELPDPADGWSELCARLINDACGNNLIGTEEFDAATWGGPVPFLDRRDLLTAASDIDPDDVSTGDLLSAFHEAMRFVGLV